MPQATDVQSDDSSFVQVVFECIYFFLLSTPLALALINLQAQFDIRLDDFLFILEHPVPRGIFAAAGGLALWWLLKPAQPSSALVPNRWAGVSEYSLQDGEVKVCTLTEERLQQVLDAQGTIYLHRGTTPPSKEELQTIGEICQRSLDESAEEVWDEDAEDVSSEIPAPFDPHQTVRLSIELVPRTCWFSNLRSGLSVEQWKALRRRVYKSAGYHCQVCNGRGPDHPVEAHETWSYDDKTGVQRLECVRALCPSCHTVKHFGLATMRGKEGMARRHLMAINAWSVATASSYIEYSFEQWRQRSERAWSLDLSHLKEYGYSAEEIAELERTRVQH